MFKNVIMYRIAAGWSATAAQIEESLDSARFVACGASQEKSIGWIEPRGEANGHRCFTKPSMRGLFLG